MPAHASSEVLYPSWHRLTHFGTVLLMTYTEAEREWIRRSAELIQATRRTKPIVIKTGGTTQ